MRDLSLNNRNVRTDPVNKDYEDNYLKIDWSDEKEKSSWIRVFCNKLYSKIKGKRLSLWEKVKNRF